MKNYEKTLIKQHISSLSDKKLLEMLGDDPRDWTPEALTLARQEAESRGGIDIIRGKAELVGNQMANDDVLDGNKNPNFNIGGNKKTTIGIVLLIVSVIAIVFGLASQSGNPKTRNGTSGTSETTASASVDPDPTGTWSDGDQNSAIHNRITITSYGTFSFETIDFTGDVKGGYSGRWHMNGNSIRFEWGSGSADSGSCSGYKTGQNSLLFGSTSFHRVVLRHG